MNNLLGRPAAHRLARSPSPRIALQHIRTVITGGRLRKKGATTMADSHVPAPSNEADAAFTATTDRITQALLATTRTVSAISAEDLPFHRSLSPEFAKKLDEQHLRLLALAEQLLANAAAGTSNDAPKFRDEDALDGAWRGIVDVVDGLLERADMCLDEYRGVIKRPPPAEVQKDPQQGQSNATSAGGVGVGSRSRVPRYLDIPKPQLQFEHPPNNRAKDAFRPLLTTKPHATVPLEHVLKRRSPLNIHTSTEQYVHPYKTEIEAYEYPSFVREVADPIPYNSFEDTQAIWVDTEEALNEMIEELKSAKEIAVDLEHHETRTYVGIVSLMQISTREKDWIVDTLKPWRSKLERLNEVFADPSILKVFHGSQMDVVWLQRDFGVYLVGLFDTYHACRALKYPGASLAFLLRKFIDFEAQKQYQLADWRIRPIPQEMLNYARSDTHFLLYIYDNLRNELVNNSTRTPDGDLIEAVQQGSKDYSLIRYENSIYDAERGLGFNGWYRILSRTPALFTKEQFSVFRAAHAWRDTVAREEDESLNYVLPNHMLFSVARDMPTDKVNMFKVIAPMSQVVRLRVDELADVVKRAKEKGSSGPDMIAIMDELNKLILESKPAGRPAPQVYGAATSAASAVTAKSAAETELKPAPILKSLAERLTSSKLWGKAFGSPTSRSSKPLENVTLDLPLPNLTAEIFDTNNPYTNTETASPATPKPEHTYVPPTERKNAAKDGLDDVFVVKELGGKKRKRTATSTPGSNAAQSSFADGHDELDISGLGDADDDETQRKKEERAARKAAKKAAKRAAREADPSLHKEKKRSKKVDGDTASTEIEGDEEEYEPPAPLDYAAAPSLLQGSVDEQDAKRRKGGKAGKGGTGLFDVYGKGLNAPKGLGRSQKERAGRSVVFKK